MCGVCERELIFLLMQNCDTYNFPMRNSIKSLNSKLEYASIFFSFVILYFICILYPLVVG